MVNPRIDLCELPSRFAELLTEAAANGGHVVITAGEKECGYVAPSPPPFVKERTLGLHPGAIEVSPDFDKPLPDEILDWEQMKALLDTHAFRGVDWAPINQGGIMRAEDICEFVQQKPFQPFRVTLTDGRSYEVHHPELAMVGRSTVAIGIPATGTSESIYDRLVNVSLLHVMQVEPVVASS